MIAKSTHILRKIAILCITIINIVHVQAQPVIDDAIPDAVPLVEVGEDTTLFLLFGTATGNPRNPGLADMVMLVAVHRDSGAVSMLSIPRDLWVYAPDAGMMKLTSVFFWGATHESDGTQLLKETIRYNLGLEVDYYAHVDFDGFLSLIDLLDGVTLTVDCVIQDWRLKSPELDKQVEENYEMFTMPVGLHEMDADTALWYVRSRRTSSDFDRGRRQQDVLRAMWRKIRDRGLLGDLPAIWETVTRTVDTDFTLEDALGFAPMAMNFEANRAATFRFKNGTHVKGMLSPAPEHSSILAPQRDALDALIRDFVAPPTPNRIARAALRVQVVNASGVRNMAAVAADRLSQEGFIVEIAPDPATYRNYTQIYDFTGQTKGSAIPDLMRVLRVNESGVSVKPDAARTYDYQIFIGNQYAYWSCTRDVIQPQPETGE